MKHKYKFINNDLDHKVIITSNSEQCTVIIERFYYFLLGCSFQKDTILSCMRNVLDEYDEREDD